jgi:hypothetical protein
MGLRVRTCTDASPESRFQNVNKTTMALTELPEHGMDSCGLAKSICVWAAWCLQYYKGAYTTLFVDTIRKIVRRVSVDAAAAVS